MVHILILGGGGFIGRPLTRTLAARGLETSAASRSGEGPNGLALDRRRPAEVLSLVRRRRVDVVIDLIAYVESDTCPLLAALDGEVGRYVMASSGDVYRNYEGLHRKARPRAIVRPLSEASPLRTTRRPYARDPPRPPDDPDAWLDAYDKIPLEEALRARPSLAGVILRLPMVFGPSDRHRRFRWILGPMLAGAASLRVQERWAEWRTTYGFVDDVADALALAALHPSAAGETFNVGEAAARRHRDWIWRFAERLGWGGAVEETPPSEEGPLKGLDLRYPLATDTSRLRQRCGWREPTPPEEALLRTICDERARV